MNDTYVLGSQNTVGNNNVVIRIALDMMVMRSYFTFFQAIFLFYIGVSVKPLFTHFDTLFLICSAILMLAWTRDCVRYWKFERANRE